MKNMLLFPAIFIGSIELLYSIKSMDMEYVLAIYRESFVNKFNPNGNYLIDEFESPNQTIAKIDEYCRKNNVCINGIISIDDELQFKYSKKLAKHYNIEFYSDLTLNTASNKFLMKTRFRKFNVPTSKFVLYCGPDKKQIDYIGFPNVLKILAGSGSECIFLNNNIEELEKNFDLLKKEVKYAEDSWFKEIKTEKMILDPRRQFLLEQYIGGEEFSCDFLLDGGRLSILRIVKKFDADNIGYFLGFYLINWKTAESFGISNYRLEELCRNIAQALSITKGVCMVDFKLVDKEIFVIESSIRPGFSTFVPLMEKIYGYTSMGMLARLKIGLDTSFNIPETEGLVILLEAPNPGRVAIFDTNLLEQDKNLGLLELYKYNKEGDIISDSTIDHHDMLMGFVLLKNPSNIPNLFKVIRDKSIIVIDEIK